MIQYRPYNLVIHMGISLNRHGGIIMIQYRPYNLVIHGNPQYRRADFPFEPNKGAAAEAYEQRVRLTLNAIGHTSVGKALFGSLYARVPVYIVPYIGDYCNAVTGQLSSDLMRGVRVQYSPETYTFDACGRFPGYRADETLFHELVHASRTTNYGFVGMKKGSLEHMQDPEEFLAVMLTNMYRSERGAQKFNRDYRTGQLVSQVQLEMFLASRREYLDELADYMSDVLVKLVAPLKMPFNPFRDLKRLRAIQNLPMMSGPNRLA